MCSGTELFDLIENESSTLVFILDLIELVDDDEEVRLFVACVPEEFFGGESEVVLCRNDEDDDVNFFLTSKDSCGFEAVAVEAWCVDKGNINNAVVKERFGWSPGVRQVNLDHLLGRFVICDDFFQVCDGTADIG